MSYTGIIIGSVIFLVLGTIGYAFAYIKVGQSFKNIQQKKSN